MPWIAEHKGEKVTPQDVTSRDYLTCPECNEEMHIRGPYSRRDGSFVARHFSHNPSEIPTPSDQTNSDCKGETDEHQRMKSIAFSKLKHVFGDSIEEIELEMPIGDGTKRADVGVEFTEHIDEHPALRKEDSLDGAIGDKLAIEAQYHNESKDIQETARTYAVHGYSVLWLYPEQFEKSDVELFTGPGAQWMPIYPAVTRSDVEFPASWNDHAEHVTVTDTETVIEAAFPVEWYKGELKNYLATIGSETQYERWAQLFPNLAQDFVELAEEMLTTPESKARLLLETLFPTMDKSVMGSYFDKGKIPASEAVCGNCHWSLQDEYRDSETALICWRNQPDGPGRQPRKVSRTDEFAQDCPEFSFDPYINEQVADSMDLHERLQRPALLKELVGAKGASKRDQRKAALKFAYYRTWGSEGWNDFNFSPAREEGFLRHLKSDQAVPHEDGCATRGETIFPPREVDPENQTSLGELMNKD